MALYYDSNIWNSSTGSWQPTNVSNSNGTANSMGGWRLVTSGDTGWVGYLISDCYFYGFIWTDPQGTQHSFSSIETANTSYGCTNVPSWGGLATDGTGYFMAVTDYTSATVYAPDGREVYPKVEDTNGNYYSTDANGNVIDSLGRTLVTTSISGNQITYSVLNSQGTRSQYVATTTSDYVSTSFGGGDTEYSGTLYPIEQIALPDGTYYYFGYDSGFGGYYGQLKSMTLPTGGEISYKYQQTTDAYGQWNSIIWQRQTPDDTSSAWVYGFSIVSPCSSGQQNCQQAFTVTKPNQDYVVYTFALNGGAWPTQIKAYDHSVGLLSTANICYSFENLSPAGQYPFCALESWGGSPAYYVYRMSATATFPIPGSNLTTAIAYQWDNGNLGDADLVTGTLTKLSEWNFGNSSGTPDRITSISYLGGPGTSYYTAPGPVPTTVTNILNRPTNVTITDGSGNALSQILNCYDYAGGCGGSSFASQLNIQNHDDAGFPATYTVRGDLTQVKRLVSGTSNYVTASMTYDMTGQAISSIDPNNNPTTYSYADNFFNDNGNTMNPAQPYIAPAQTNAYLTKISPPLIPATTAGYYYGTGQPAEATDANGKTTYAHFYDLLNRPTAMLFPDTGWTLVQYNSTETQVDTYTGITTSSMTSSCPPSNSGGCRHDQITLDGLGRVTTSALVNDLAGPISVTSTYDTNGRISTVTNPYRNTSESTYGLESLTYDGSDRINFASEADGSLASTFYGSQVSSFGGATSQSCSPSTYGTGYPILYRDEANLKRQTWTDGFGRIIETDEPDSSGNFSTNAATTCYAYDLNNNLTQVVQGSETRTYTFDKLSRLTSAMNPEIADGLTGQPCSVGYTYDGNGNIHTKTGPMPNQKNCSTTVTTTNTFDALNRLLGKTYSDGVTPAANFVYDLSTFQGYTIQYPVGRLVGNYTGSAGSPLVWNLYSYDSMGRIYARLSCYKNNCASPNQFHSIYTYDLNGDVTSLDDGQFNQFEITYGYSYDSTGRVTQMTSDFVDPNHPATLATVQSYWPNGGIQATQFGHISGAQLTETTAYNNRLQPCRMNLNSSATSFSHCTDATPSGNVFDLTYGYNSGGNNGDAASWSATNGTFTETKTYSYDSLNRLSGISASWDPNGCTGYSWSYDRYGNRMAQTGTAGTNCMQSSLGYNTNNHITNSGFVYDAAGNMASDSSFNYTYDSENRLTAETPVGNGAPATYVYDAEGARVEKVVSGAWRDYLHEASGNVGVEISATSTGPAYFYLGGPLLGEYTNGSTYFVHEDRLGSSQVMTALDTSKYNVLDFMPFGEQIYGNNPGSGNDLLSHKFTGYDRDEETDPLIGNGTGNGTGNDYAFARYYSSRNGGFISPDPMGGNITDPQTLNKYAYARDNPVNNLDPTGLECEGDPGCCDPSQACCDPEICGIPCPDCGGGGGGGGISPAPPLPPPSPEDPSADPWALGCESLGMPCNMQIFRPGFPSINLPGDPGCPYGSGSCGGIIFGLTAAQQAAAARQRILDYLRWLLSRPWLLSWIVPLAGEPGAAGVGPAGEFYYNPATHVFCGGLGAGASVGRNVSVGPLTQVSTRNQSTVDDIANGWSVSSGATAPGINVGYQVTGNGSGIAGGPVVGNPGLSASSTYSVCTGPR